jgi:hypothetical protein
VSRQAAGAGSGIAGSSFQERVNARSRALVAALAVLPANEDDVLE